MDKYWRMGLGQFSQRCDRLTEHLWVIPVTIQQRDNDDRIETSDSRPGEKPLKTS
jgi:hypothetical protein